MQKGLCLLLLAGMAANAETHRVIADKYYNTFAAAHPVLVKIKPGDSVVTKTADTAGLNEKREPVAQPSNPLTGPFYIEGAEPGDALLIHFRKIRLNRNSGYSGYRLGLFSLTPEYVEHVYPSTYKMDLITKGRGNIVPWELDPQANTVRLKEPVSGKIKLEFPASPMLGCVGVAPAGDFAPTSGPSGSYGGNLDYNRVVEGSTVILPVYHSGALLFMGDGHALMGDGEPTGNGIETSMDVEFQVEVKKKARVTGPRVENSDFVISVGSQPEFASSLDRALQLATTDMVNWLVDDYGLEPWAAHLLVAFQGQYDVVTVQGSMALRIPKKYLPK